ncbi:hypothetical protein G6F23_015737 [Rhizopus arrhizus]|nr:hypothetical protein G6F23_015737 [Rhizopus arrhizus]
MRAARTALPACRVADLTLAGHHRQVQALFLRAFDRDLVAGIRMAHDARAGVIGQRAGNALGGFVRVLGGAHV